jgi:ribosomal protein L11 methyltransferase
VDGEARRNPQRAVTMRYLRRTYAAEGASRELLAAALWAAGTLGIEEGAELVAWFAAVPPAIVLPAGAALRGEEWVAGEDWLAGYRAVAQPLAIGRRLWVDPREPEGASSAAAEGRIALRIPARTAFGTGSHASTRLALRLLEELPLAGARVLDVGTGSGILSLAAVALGARLAVGCDVDPAASLLAGQHARLNATAADPRASAFWAGSLAALAAAARFEVVLANALPHELRDDAAGIVAALAPGGRLVVSGVPVGESHAVLAAWAELGLRPLVELVEEEWVAWVLGPGAAPVAPDE